MNTPGHRSFNERTNIFVLNCSLGLVHSSFFIAIDCRNILKIAFSSLVTNWAVKRVICKQKLHDTTSCNSSSFRFGKNLKLWSNLSGTSSEWLWHTFTLNKAHSAVSSHRKSFMVAETRDFDTGFGASLENSVRAINFNGFAINVHVEPVG